MALIGKIREKSWLILIIVGGALIAFILGDYNKGTAGVESKYGYGTVYGEKVDIDKFNEAVAIADENARRNAQQQGQQPQPVDKSVVWKSFVENILMEKEVSALGLEVTNSEFDAFLYGKEGFDVLPEFLQGFKDSTTGMFNEKLLQSRIEEMESSDDPNVQKQWADSKEYYQTKRKQDKYFEILNQGLYVTNLEAKNEYFAQKEVKSISYVLKRFSSIKNEDIDTSEDKLKAYFEENKNNPKYENKIASRDVKFFDIAIQPSSEDSARFKSVMEELSKEFASTTNDSLFVMKNSDFKFFSSGHMATFKKEGDEKARQGLTYPASMDSVFKNAAIGDIVGPYDVKGTTRIAKVLDFNRNLLSVRHILISGQRGDTLAVEKAKRKADSLLPLINKDNFEEYVVRFSEDPGSKNTGGKYEDFMDYEMVPEFSEFASTKAIGTIGYVQTNFGYHIMEVLDRKEIKEPVLAIVEKSLTPSQNTIDETEQEIYDLLYKLDEEISNLEPAKKVEMFDTIVNKAGHFARSINIQEMSPKVYGFTSKFAEDKLLELAYNNDAQVGDLVGSPIKDKNRYVIAILAGIKEKGVPSFEDARVSIERDYIEEEKTKKIMAQMIGAKSLTDLTSKDASLIIQKAELTFANPQISGAGFEPDVVGALYSGLKDGEVTVPIRGKSGVYVIQVENTTKAPTAANYMVEKDQLLAGMKGSVSSNAKKGLTKLADVIDNRRFFEINIRR